MARRTAEEAQETVELIIETATHHFGQHGYAATSLEAVVQEAGVTRGALYHHFNGKQGLFEAVVRKVQDLIAARVEDATKNETTLWAGFVAGCRAWLEVASEPLLQRILLVDAPAVLGWEQWLQIDEEGGASLLREGVKELKEAGMIRDVPTEALFHLLNGAMNQAALWIAQADDPEQVLTEAQSSLEILLSGLKIE